MASIIHDYKAIHEACDSMSKETLNFDKSREEPAKNELLDVEFVPDEELEAAINTRTRLPTPPPAPPSPMPPVAKQGRGAKSGAIARYACPRCGSGCAMKPGYGWYCSNCDEFVG